MTSDDRVMGDLEYAFGEALGHMRNATEVLVGTDEQTESLLLGLSCLDLQGMFGDIWPGWGA